MMDGNESAAERNGLYRATADMIADLVAISIKHTAEAPACSAAPLCIGPEGVTALGLAYAADPSAMLTIALVAVSELADARRRLDVQREMYAGLTRNLEQIMEEADAERGRAELAEKELGKALAELTAWEESADVIGPVLPVVEP